MKKRYLKKYINLLVLTFVLPLSANQPAKIEQVREAEGWFVRLIAENQTEGLVDRGNVFGELPDSSDQYDSHDLPELAPFSDPYLTVVFKRDNWGENNGNYNSDFRQTGLRLTNKPKVWRFTVVSNDPNRDVKLSWESDLNLADMRLVDMETGQVIFPVIGDLLQDYQFNMAGKTEREFIWKY